MHPCLTRWNVHLLRCVTPIAKRRSDPVSRHSKMAVVESAERPAHTSMSDITQRGRLSKARLKSTDSIAPPAQSHLRIPACLTCRSLVCSRKTALTLSQCCMMQAIPLRCHGCWCMHMQMISKHLRDSLAGYDEKVIPDPSILKHFAEQRNVFGVHNTSDFWMHCCLDPFFLGFQLHFPHL